MIIFVGDCPSKKNISKHVPFIGTKSYDTLSEWFNVLDLRFHEYILYNSHTDKLLNKIKIYDDNNFTIIALGNKAADRLKKRGIQILYKLPHPSPRNRKLNDKQFVINELKKCKEVLNEKI